MRKMSDEIVLKRSLCVSSQIFRLENCRQVVEVDTLTLKALIKKLTKPNYPEFNQAKCTSRLN
jgi:hypothetical protein